MSQLMKKRFPSITSIDVESDGNTSFLRAARNGQLDKVLEHLKSNIDINTSNANGLNALHLASKDGHVEIVEELLKRGAVVDAATKKGNTALHIASLAGQEEVVKLLVQHGASVNVQSQNGFTPLYMAAQENHDNVVKYLLANGANQSLSTEDGFTPLAVAMQQGHDKVVTVLLENDTRGKIRLPALHIAAKKDDVKAAKLLLENEHNPDVTSKSGFTPLHIASHYGNQQIANLLIQKGADVNYAAKHNITPLHVAAKWGKTNMVALLLEHGATIESKTRDGLTPLHCAARSGHEQVVDMLLERGAPISSKTKNGLAPLHMAAQGDHVDAARILLYHRAPVDEVTVDYLTALHVAAHCGHVRVAKLLLDRQADANARALNGFTPLHIACKKNRIKVVELLLKHGASIGATTESGLTPLHVASFMGCMNIVIYLLQHDANPDVPTVRGETPLHLAARANQTDIIRILLRNGAQVDARAREQQTPLHIASRLGNVDIVMLLLQHGAKVDNTTKDMYTALHIAAKEGQDEVAAVLLDHGASLDATTKKGFTPLHLAAKYGHLKVAKLLSQKEAPVDAQGKNGVTPLHVASHYDHQNVALLLLDKGASPYATAKNGHTPLHIAARKNQMDIANTLLEYGAQPNAESKAGFTPLHLSAQEGHADMSSLLVEHKADANYEAKNGLTPLHLCAQEDRVPVAEILVKNGADVNAATKGGYTPLHIASHYGQTNMVRFLLQNGANVKSTTSLDYTPLHQAAQQGHANIVNILLENSADPNAVTTNGQTPLNIAQKLGYITVIETLKVVTTTTTITTTTTTNIEEKYRVQAPELMHETFMSDSEEEGGEDTVLGDQTYRYLTADEMKSLGDDSLPIDVTRDERIDSNRMVSSADSNMLPPQHIEDSISPEHVTQNYVEYIKKYTPDNVDIGRHPISIGFLVSFLVDARGGAMRGCRHSGVRVIVPPRCAPSPTRITCRYVRPQRTPHPPPLMEGEALASRVLELGPVGAKFLGPVIIEVPHFAALRGKEREIVILRSDNGESWKEHTVEATEEVLNEVLHDSFEAEDLNQLEDMSSGRITRILTQDFPQYFAVVSRIRQEVHAIGPEGGMVSSTVVPQVQAVFPEGALTKKIKVGLQAQPIDPELTAKLLGHGVAVSPVVTVEPRRRKFHKAITLSMPAPRAHSQGMINQYSGSAPTLRLLCSITGGTTRAQWEDVTGSTPLTFVNDCVSFTTTVSARFWLMDCRNIGDATKMATELYKEAIHVPFMAKFVVFAKRVDPLEARLRVFCMTDDKEDKTLEHQEHFTEVAKSRDVEVLEGKLQYVEFAGNLVPITKSGEQLSFSFRAFRENRLPFSVRVKDQHAEAVSRCLFMKEPKVPKGEPPQQPICILNIVLPDDIVTDTISLTDTDSLKKHTFLSENFDYYRPDPRLADMSNLLGEDWVPLANQLGLTTSEINVIKSEYPDSVAKQAQSMLRMWLSQSGNKAQTNTLENALRRIGREDIIPQCLNVDHTGQTITRIKQEEIGKYRLKKDIDIIDKEVVTRDDIGDERLMADKQEVKRKLDIYDKYSAEEKAIDVSEEEEEEEEEAFDKPVAERREQIEKRLSAERTIPASSQRREIVQEITSIKRQSIVEDKIAEVQQKTTPDQKTTPEQTKTTQEQIKTTTTTITTISPETKTVSETVEVKTTIPSDSKVSETVKKPSLEKIHEVKTTTVTETRTIQPEETTHRTADDAELLEGVTQSLEKTKKPIPKLIADEDPKSPKFSKTPPPSPADFLIREQAATVQEWDASRKPAEPESKTLGPDAAQQGKTTSTAHYLVSNEELSLVQIPVGAIITGLPATENNLLNLKQIYDQTNALIQSESRAEPYHHHTEKYYKIDKVIDDERQNISQTTSGKEEKKRKKGILGTIKTFVGKSLDHSDSESEKSPKKEKKIKKDKKKVKIPDSELPPEIPVRPPRKPKLPTPTEDRKYADIPYFEASPENGTYKSTLTSTRESTPLISFEKDEPVKLSEVVIITGPVTDLDDTDSDVPESIKNQAKEIITDIITDGEKAATEQLLQKSPKMKKRKFVIVEEKVKKTFTPVRVEEEEFTIIIDPTKIGSPKKTRETFTLNIDESIDKIEKEILEKSPILPDEKLIKPSAQIDAPVRPPRIKDHVYEDIEEPVISHPPDHFEMLPEYFNFPHPDDIKIATIDLIKHESEFTGWEDDKHNLFNINRLERQEEPIEKITDSQKMKRKHGKLFGLFGKISKDGDDSDEESKKEVIEKQDKEASKEQKIKTEVQKSPKLKKCKSKDKPEKIDVEIAETQGSPKKSKGKDKEEKGFLGLFRKGKKDDIEVKPTFSESVIKDMIDSTAFLKEEVDKYHDVKPVIVAEIRKKAEKSEQALEPREHITEIKQDVPERSPISTQKSEPFSADEIDVKLEINGNDKFEIVKDHHAVATTTELNKQTEKAKEKQKEDGRGFFGIFKKKSEEKDIEPKTEKSKEKPILSQATLKNMQESESFIKDELDRYHDVRPIIKRSDVETEESKYSASTLQRTAEEKGSIPEEAKDKLLLSESVKEVDETFLTQENLPREKQKEKKEERTGFFGFFKKKPSEEREPEHKTEEKKSRPTLSETTLRNMQESESFLSDEIKIYHDVRPIIQDSLRADEKTLTEKPKQKQKDDGTVLFGLFKKKSSEERDTEVKVEKIKEKPVLSQNTIKDMHESESFLRDEIRIYHDVRPIIPETTTFEEVQILSELKGEDKDDGKGFLGLFKKKSPKEKKIEDEKKKSKEKPVKSSEEKDIESTVEKSNEKPVLLESTIKDMQETDSFLRDEVRIYHDVRPIIQKEPISDKKITTEEHKQEVREDGTVLFELLKQKSSEERDIEQNVQKIEDKLILSESTIRDMQESDSFLRDEVRIYHDVRPIISETAKLKDVEIPSEKLKGEDKDSGKGFLGLFKKKSPKDKQIEAETKKTKDQPVLSSEEKDFEPEVEKIKEKPVLSENTMRDMQESDSFLRDEVRVYHDVRPIISKTATLEEVQTPPAKLKGEDRNDGKGFLGLFKKKSPKEKQIEAEVKKIKDKPALSLEENDFEPEAEKIKEKSVLSENTIRDIQESDSFLRDEVRVYHDVRPIISNIATFEEVQASPEKLKDEDRDDEKGFLGLFKKKSPNKEQIEVDIKKTKDKSVLSSEERNIEPRVEIIEDKPALSENIIKDMQETDAFLRDEVKIYHDVRPIIPETATLKEVQISSGKLSEEDKDGKGFLGLFKKKSPKEQPVEAEVNKTKDKPVLSENVLRNMDESDSFLKDEIKVYHDVRPIIQNVSVSGEKTSTEKPKQEQKEDGTVLFGLFKRKSSEERDTEPKVEKIKEKSVLSENSIKDMQETDSFLKDEVNIYHDVRPIIPETAILEQVQVPTENLKETDRDDGKGFLGLFKKKSSKEKQSHPMLSESAIRNMNESDSFLKDEIKIYHDVRPIIQEKCLSNEEIPTGTPKEQKGDGTTRFGLFKKESSEGKDIEPKVDKINERPALSENTIKDMQETDSFLTDEVRIYHDVRPTIPETARLEEVHISSEKLKDRDDGKGFLGLFKKKSPKEKQLEAEKKKIEERPVMSESVIRNINESDSFLKDEIEIYHDVRPVIQKESITDEKISTEKPKQEQKNDGTGLFGLFKKKSSEERDIETKVEKIKEKPVLSENAIKDMQETDSFLRDEVRIYHDVRPIITETATLEEVQISSEKLKEEDKEGKGFLALFKKKSPKEKSVEAEIKKTKDKPVLSENVIRNMSESDSFLKDEIKVYHDVRPIIQKESMSDEKTSTEKPKQEQKDDGTVLFGLFKKKSSEEKEIEPKMEKIKEKSVLSENTIKDMDNTDLFLRDEVRIYHDVRPIIPEKATVEEVQTSSEKIKDEEKEDGKGFLGLFKKKSPKEKHIETGIKKTKDKPPVLSESVIRNINESDSFLNDEIKVYHDVRPIIQKESISDEKISTEKPKQEQKDDGTVLFGLFKKKPSEERDIEPKVEKIKQKPVLSENAIKDMQKTDSFLRGEVSTYHDVRPIIPETAAVEEVQTSFEKIPDDKEDGKGFLGLFKKKSPKEKQIEAGIKKAEDKPMLSESVIRNINESDSFLKDEITVYHDVRPIIQKESMSDEESSTERPKQKQKDDGTILFGPLKKKSSEERDIDSKIEKIKDKPLLSENIIKDMQETDSFLRDEVSIYHDVRPIIPETVTVEEVQTSFEKIKGEDKDAGKGFLGLFKKKPPKEKQIETEIKKTKNKPVLSSEERDIEPKVEQIIEKPALSETTIKDMQGTESFLRDEVKIYHDVRPIITETATLEEDKTTNEKPKEKHKDDVAGFFGLRKKKSSEEKEIEAKIGKSKDVPVLSESVIKDMHESDSFLEDEIKIYHDVRPIIQETAKEEKITIDRSKDEHKDDGRGFFGLFKKKPSVEKEITPKVDDIKQTLSESTLRNMQESDSFLKDEIKVYHDVRPIVRETITIESQAPTDKAKPQRRDGETGFFGLFKKKSSEEKDTNEKAATEKPKDEDKKRTFKTKKGKKIDLRKDVTEQHPLSPTAIKDMSDAKTFIKKEVDIYHDTSVTVQKDSTVKTDEPKEASGYSKEKIEDKRESEPAYAENKQKDKKTETEADTEAKNIHDTTNFLNTELERYEDAKLIPTTELKSKEYFFADTAQIKQDQNVPEITTLKSEQTSSKSGKLFGIFGKKKSQDRESSIDRDKKKDKKQLKQDADLPISTDKDAQVTLEQDIVKETEDKSDSKDFLKGEIDRYHDAEISKDKLPEVSPPETEEQLKEKSGGLFGLFSKKTKPQEKSIKEISVEKEYSPSPVIKDISDSENFIQNEITKYEAAHSDKALRTEKVLEPVQTSPIDISSEQLVLTDDLLPVSIDDTNTGQIEIKKETMKKLAEYDTIVDDKPSKIEKSTTVTKETVIFKDIVQIDPSILTDLNKLEEDIKTKIEQFRDEAKSLEGGKSIAEAESQLKDVDPHLMKMDVSDEATKIHEGTKNKITIEKEVLTEPLASYYVKEAKDVLEEELKQHDDTSLLEKKEIYEKDKDKKTGIFRIFKRKSQSQEREPSEEKYIVKSEDQTDLENEKVNREDRKKAAPAFKIFGKKQLSEEKVKQDIPIYENIKFPLSEQYQTEESKPTEASKMALENIQNTQNFLSVELENYEDGKPEIITDLDEDVERIKSSGLFGIFSKKDKSESPKITKRKYKKPKKSQEDLGIIEKIGRKLTGSSTDSKEYTEDTPVSTKENLYNIDQTESVTEGAARRLEDIAKETSEDSEKLLGETEREVKFKKVSFVDAKDNVIEKAKEVSAEHIKDFTEQGVEKIPKEKIIPLEDESGKTLNEVAAKFTEENDDADDFFSQIDERIKQESDDINRTLKEAADRTHETLEDLKLVVKDAQKDASKKFDVIQQKAEVLTEDGKDAVGQTAKKTGGFFTKLGEKISSKSETVKDNIKSTKEEAKRTVLDKKESEDKIDDLKRHAEGSTIKNIDILDTSDYTKDVKDASDSKGKKDKKSKKSFFTKLGAKIGVKGEDIKDTTDELEQNVNDAKIQNKETAAEILEDITSEVDKDKISHLSIEKTEIQTEQTPETLLEEVVPGAQSFRDDSSSFVTEIMQSFDDTLEHVKEEVKELKGIVDEHADSVKDVEVENREKITGAAKQTGTFLEQVDEKFSETIKLTEEMSKESKQKIKDPLQGNQEFLQKEKDQVDYEISSPIILSGETVEMTVDMTKDIITDVRVVHQEHEVPEKSIIVNKVFKSTERVDDGSIKSKDKLEDSLEESKESVAKIEEKNSGFFSKLGDKITGKSKYLEKDIQDDTEKKIEQQQEILKTTEIYLLEQNKSTPHGIIKADTKLQSTERDVGQIKDHSLDATDDKLSDSESTIKTSFQTIKDDAKYIEGNVKYSSIHGATETGDFFDQLGEFISEKSKKVEDELNEVFNKTGKGRQKVEEGIAIAVQNVDDAAEVALKKSQEVKESAIESYDISKSIVKDAGDAIEHKTIEVAKQTDLLKTVKGEETDAKEAGPSNQGLDETKKSVVIKEDTLPIKSKSKTNEDIKDGSDKTSKKSKRFLGKLGRKFSGKGEELKEKSYEESTKLEKTKSDFDKKHKKSIGLFGKLGDKITGKSEESKQDVEKGKSPTESLIKTAADQAESHISDIKTATESESAKKRVEKPEVIFAEDTRNNFQDMKQTTLDFIETECLHIDDSKMTRTMSDYGSKIKDPSEQPPRKISEANIDLSNLPANIDEYSKQSGKIPSSYVTSPSLARRTVSQRFPKGERPEVIEVTNFDDDNFSDDESYIVTEPEEISKDNTHLETERRKPLFHLESEEDNLDTINSKAERQDSTKSNVLETLTELKIDSLISDLTKTLNEPLDIKKPLESEIRKEERRLEEHKKESEAEVDLIEKKLSDLDKALESLEQIDLQTETDDNKDDAKIEKKLRRVERKFERMASEVIDDDVKQGKEIQLTSPEVKEKQETEFRRLVSQLSTDEISDFQKEYSHLWDEHTFSKSDDWDSKTPDSQADAQELPQGGEEATSSTIQQPSTSVRAEGEEAEKEESGFERRVPDQHQLSDEMKELLKELEKESKQ